MPTRLLRQIPRHPLLLIPAMLAILVALPVGSVLTNLLLGGTGETWQHLADTVLSEYVGNTLWLLFGVGTGVTVLGIATGWLTAVHRFPGHTFFDWALVLPMAMPAYVMAYVYTDLLQFVGPVQTTLRETFGWSKADYWFPDVRSRGGAIFMFVLVLYPYVYLLARTAFLERAHGMIEAARTLGMGPWRSFFSVSLPMARPAVAAGASLALMETLADYGTVSYFAVPTFTTGIYRAWFSMGDRVAAAQLAAALLGFIILLMAFEQLSRGKARFHDTTQRQRATAGSPLRGGKAALATFFCSLPVLFGFLLPALWLLRLAMSGGAEAPSGDDGDFVASASALGGGIGRFLGLVANSVTLAGLTALLAVTLALLLAYAGRLWPGWLMKGLNRLVGLGYAVPGSVIAVGVLIPVTRLDHWLAAQWADWFGTHPGLLITGGIAAMIYAYLVRLLAVALQTVQSGLSRVTRSMDDVARSLGESQFGTLRRVHAPLLRGSLLTAGLLVFVDVMKELPATLVMRPFNFDTLATQTYTLAADERLAEAALPALAIVAAGLLPLILLSRQIARARQGKSRPGDAPAAC